MAWNWKNEMILTKWANVDKADKVALKFWKDWSSEIKKFLFKISIRESLQLEVEQLG